MVEDRFPFLIMTFCNIIYLVSTVLFLIFEDCIFNFVCFFLFTVKFSFVLLLS